MEDNECLITVCTPTYNRANLLNVPFLSLLNQTNKKFIWLIIDDGSTDNTYDVVKKFKQYADFSIEYYKKENGGRHTALNYSYDYIKTEYVINLDSDDELTSTCIEDLYNAITTLKNGSKNIWQIVGLCKNQRDELIGRKFNHKINNLSKKNQRKYAQRYIFEKSCCRKTEILKKFRFPVYTDTKFVTENTVWSKISLSYDSFYLNKILRVYNDNTGESIINSSNSKSFSRMKSRYYYSCFCLQTLISDKWFDKNYKISRFNIARSAMCCNISYREVMRNIPSKTTRLFVTFVGYPVALLYILLKKERKKCI